MVNSDFHYMGMPVLESDDMINWKIISQVYRRLDFPDWDTNGNYGGGSWAPSIRHHDGKFWIYFTAKVDDEYGYTILSIVLATFALCETDWRMGRPF